MIFEVPSLLYFVDELSLLSQNLDGLCCPCEYLLQDTWIQMQSKHMFCPTLKNGHFYYCWVPYSQSAKMLKNIENQWKIDISTRNRSPKKYVPLDILNIPIFYFGLPGNDCTNVQKMNTTAEEVGLRRPTSCAILGS